MLYVTGTIAIDEALLEENFITATGPGGQNVNKVATAVQLRFLLSQDRDLADDIKVRLRRLAGQRLTQDGDVLIQAQRFRTRERNRADARERLVELIREAAKRPVQRRPTRPTKASKQRRVAGKTHRGRIKQMRGRVKDDG